MKLKSPEGLTYKEELLMLRASILQQNKSRIERKVAEIANIEKSLFEAIELEQNTKDDAEKNYLICKINSLQTQYSIAHI